ncbi:MAG: phosphoribosylanthranilate isomerase [Firmicutes bacterium]|nr:phosphoribosylanthranilate isomerase [Bacillota bacterium]
MTRVKICGLMNHYDVTQCVNNGADMVGFVVDYPIDVPWNLTVEVAKELIKQVPAFVETCVVTGGSVEKVLALADVLHPSVIQLHHQETLTDVKEIAHQLQRRGVKTIKALRINESGLCDFEITDPILAALALCQCNLSALLVDTYSETQPGGTGITVDLSSFLKIQKASVIPVILAGGLKANNVVEIITKTKPYAVDVLTGVEECPGTKDPVKLKKFIEHVRW